MSLILIPLARGFLQNGRYPRISAALVSVSLLSFTLVFSFFFFSNLYSASVVFNPRLEIVDSWGRNGFETEWEWSGMGRREFRDGRGG